jgi:hypothetical protein
MRTGVLSDENVMKMCPQYYPVPFKSVTKVLEHGGFANQSGLQVRAPKYAQAPIRPANFQSMSNSMSKQIDPTNPVPIHMKLNENYLKALNVPTPALVPQTATLSPALTASTPPSTPPAQPSQQPETPNTGLLLPESITEAPLASPEDPQNVVNMEVTASAAAPMIEPSQPVSMVNEQGTAQTSVGQSTGMGMAPQGVGYGPRQNLPPFPLQPPDDDLSTLSNLPALQSLPPVVLPSVGSIDRPTQLVNDDTPETMMQPQATPTRLDHKRRHRYQTRFQAKQAQRQN